MDDLVRIAFFCKDRDTGRALRALMGIAQGQPEVYPVVNADLTKNGLQQRTRGTTSELFLEHLKKNNQTNFVTDDIKAFLSSIGYSPTSAPSTLEQMFNANTVQRVGRGKFALVYGSTKPKQVEEEEPGARAGDQFIAHLKKNKQLEFSMADLRVFLKSIGRSPRSTYSAMQVMTKEKTIRRLGRNRYTVKG